jgi:serine/threonine-protein kinase
MDTTPHASNGPSGASLTGRRLGDYQLLRLLGKGGMSQVYLAEQQSLQRKVAFKVLKSDLAEDESFVRRFHKEAQAAASLVHANIVQIHEVGCIEGIHFIAQEYVAGQNLSQYLSRHGALDAELATSILLQVAAALSLAGQQGIIHRDIKPENIMLAPSGEVKVADFGLARITADGERVDATQVGITMGTPLYMSPEQAEGEQVDPRSDLYSLGVTCYHMLAGRPPFEGQTALSIAVQHLKRDPDDLLDLRPELPEQLTGIVHKMLNKDAADRFQSAGELLNELRELDLEGFDIYWPTELDGLDVSGSMDLADVRVQATQQLDTLMKTATFHSYRRIRLPHWIGLTLAVFGMAAILPLILPPNPVLQVAARNIAQRVSVEEQFYEASRKNTEDSLKSVELFFPPADSPKNQYFTFKARQKLADLFLEQNRLDEALDIYDDLSVMGALDVKLQAFGTIGQANVLVRRGQLEEATARLAVIAHMIWNPEIELPVEVTKELLQKLDLTLRGDFEGLLLEIDTP